MRYDKTKAKHNNKHMASSPAGGRHAAPRGARHGHAAPKAADIGVLPAEAP